MEVKKSKSPFLANAARNGVRRYRIALERGVEVEDVGHLEANPVD